MTILAFIFGSVPLAIATGAGSGARLVLGTAVVFGMSVATMIGIFIIPVFYVLVQSCRSAYAGQARGCHGNAAMRRKLCNIVIAAALHAVRLDPDFGARDPASLGPEAEDSSRAAAGSTREPEMAALCRDARTPGHAHTSSVIEAPSRSNASQKAATIFRASCGGRTRDGGTSAHVVCQTGRPAVPMLHSLRLMAAFPWQSRACRVCAPAGSAPTRRTPE